MKMVERCVVCGDEISKWTGFATLVYYDEVYSEEYGESIELFIKNWHSVEEVYICEKCWERIVKNIDKIKRVLEEVDER